MMSLDSSTSCEDGFRSMNRALLINPPGLGVLVLAETGDSSCNEFFL